MISVVELLMQTLTSGVVEIIRRRPCGRSNQFLLVVFGVCAIYGVKDSYRYWNKDIPSFVIAVIIVAANHKPAVLHTTKSMDHSSSQTKTTVKLFERNNATYPSILKKNSKTTAVASKSWIYFGWKSVDRWNAFHNENALLLGHHGIHDMQTEMVLYLAYNAILIKRFETRPRDASVGACFEGVTNKSNARSSGVLFTFLESRRRNPFPNGSLNHYV